MDYKIVIDSCGEVPEEWKQEGRYENVPLEIDVDGCRIVDDESFDQADFLRRVAASPECPKSSCPSPEQYLQAYERGEAGCVYVVTLSEQLSGSYNSAVLAMNLFQEKHPDRQIHVFNSRSASIGQTLIGRKAEQLHLSGKDFQEVVRETEQYVEKWVSYANEYICAKELTVYPGQTVTIKDPAAYGCIFVQGHGKFGVFDAETSVMLRFGQQSADEYFVSEQAAKAGIVIENQSKYEPIVILKHFGPNNPDCPKTVPEQ